MQYSHQPCHLFTLSVGMLCHLTDLQTHAEFGGLDGLPHFKPQIQARTLWPAERLPHLASPVFHMSSVFFVWTADVVTHSQCSQSCYHFLYFKVTLNMNCGHWTVFTLSHLSLFSFLILKREEFLPPTQVTSRVWLKTNMLTNTDLGCTQTSTSQTTTPPTPTASYWQDTVVYTVYMLQRLKIIETFEWQFNFLFKDKLHLECVFEHVWEKKAVFRHTLTHLFTQARTHTYDQVTYDPGQMGSSMNVWCVRVTWQEECEDERGGSLMGTNELDSGRLNLAFDCFDHCQVSFFTVKWLWAQCGGDIAAAPTKTNGGWWSINSILMRSLVLLCGQRYRMWISKMMWGLQTQFVHLLPSSGYEHTPSSDLPVAAPLHPARGHTESNLQPSWACFPIIEMLKLLEQQLVFVALMEPLISHRLCETDQCLRP